MRRALSTVAVVITLSLMATTGALAATAKLHYRYYCASCHGLSGKGDGPNATESQPVTPRNHTSALDMRKITDEELFEVIKLGGGATSTSRMMPPFGKTLTEPEIRALVKHLRGLCDCKAE